jgi:hypothetical protein
VDKHVVKVARAARWLTVDAPVSRAIDRAGHILCRPTLGGLRHQYAGFN